MSEFSRELQEMSNPVPEIFLSCIALTSLLRASMCPRHRPLWGHISCKSDWQELLSSLTTSELFLRCGASLLKMILGMVSPSKKRSAVGIYEKTKEK